MAFSSNPRIGMTGSGHAPRILWGRHEADSQSFKKGQLGYLASGYLTADASDTAQILGIAMFDATNVTSGHVTGDVIVLRPGDEIKIRVTNGGTDTRITAANLGIGYGLYVASNVCYLDLADTSNDRFQITKMLYESDGSTVSYWAVATIPATVLQYATGA